MKKLVYLLIVVLLAVISTVKADEEDRGFEMNFDIIGENVNLLCGFTVGGDPSDDTTCEYRIYRCESINWGNWQLIHTDTETEPYGVSIKLDTFGDLYPNAVWVAGTKTFEYKGTYEEFDTNGYPVGQIEVAFSSPATVTRTNEPPENSEDSSE